MKTWKSSRSPRRTDLALTEAMESPFASQSYSWLGLVAQLRGRVDEALEYHDKACEVETPSAFAAAWGCRLLNRAFAGDRDGCEVALAGRIGELANLDATQTAGHASTVLCAAEAAAILGLDAEAAKLLSGDIPARFLHRRSHVGRCLLGSDHRDGCGCSR